MKTEHVTFSASGGASLHALLWQPEQPKAVLQLTHGMTEHMGRYHEFAAYLASLGIALAGFDLRGHGENPGDPDVASCGEGGWQASLEDMHLFYKLLRQKFPALPHYMLGFSLGSFLLREYLNTYPGDSIQGVILMGTGYQPRWLLGILRSVIRGQIKKAGFDATSELVHQLSFGAYNNKCKPNRTEADWLCSDVAALDGYLSDPLVRKDISAGLFWELLGSMQRTGSPFEYDGWDTGLPILLLSGQNDPVSDNGKGITTVYHRMEKAGMENVTRKLISGARHDLLHEGSDKAGAARNCIGTWLLSCIENQDHR